MILVYSDDITPRHSYTWDLVFHEILGMPYEITTDKEEFKAFQGYRIAYSDESLGDCIQIKPHGLLSEKIIRNQDITIKQWEDMPVFFGDSEDMEWPFDPFAMCFYLVSRYEEYLPFKSDLHGRFPATLSMAYEHGFLDRPLVNQIVARLQNKILIKYPALNFPPIKFTFKPTFDVDIAYAHLGKGAMRAMGGFLKLFIKRDVSALSERTRTITGKIKDPYDNFDFQLEPLRSKNIVPVYFILIGDYGKYDKNISYRNKRFRELISSLAEVADIGIHPSYNAFLNRDRLGEEIVRLSSIIQKPVLLSRQHFLRIKFPQSYRDLLQFGILDDFSMGYSTHIGFRASIASPFYFYDLEEETKTNLRIHPFMFMDTAMIDHLEWTSQTALEKVTQMLIAVKSIGGEVCGVWHNYALSETGQYKGWQETYKMILKHALTD